MFNPDSFVYANDVMGAGDDYAGADPLVIRTMGRWSSDCYRLYVRACFGATAPPPPLWPPS